MPGHDLVDRPAEVMHQVPAVSDLDHTGRTTVDTLGVAATPIAAEDLDTRMADQPLGQRLGAAVIQHVDRRVVSMSIRIVA